MEVGFGTLHASTAYSEVEVLLDGVFIGLLYHEAGMRGCGMTTGVVKVFGRHALQGLSLAAAQKELRRLLPELDVVPCQSCGDWYDRRAARVSLECHLCVSMAAGHAAALVEEILLDTGNSGIQVHVHYTGRSGDPHAYVVTARNCDAAGTELQVTGQNPGDAGWRLAELLARAADAAAPRDAPRRPWPAAATVA